MTHSSDQWTPPEVQHHALPELPEGYDYPVDRVRHLSPSARGDRNRINGFEYANLGAQVASLGAEQAYVIKLLQVCETAGMKAFMEALPNILGEMQNLQRSLLNTVMQQVNAIKGVTPAGGFLSRFAAAGPVPEYITKEEVQRILASAIERLPRS